MSEPKKPASSDCAPALSAAALNKTQQLHLRVSCEYIDKILQQIEAVLHSGENASPFARYRMDMSPAEARVVEDYIRRLRQQILRTLAWQNIEPPPPEVPATRAITTNLHFIDIAIFELRPNAMRGSGQISDDTAQELTGILGEMSAIVTQMARYMTQQLGQSLSERVAKLAANGKMVGLLARVEQVITAHGLVEFRPRLESLLQRLEDPTFEVAVFGRVSAGKSSFLNALLGIDLLPVGARPITAVPTRIRHGSATRARVRFGNGELEDVPVERFRELISEAENPGNQANVRQAVLEVDAPRLAEGITLVDTPGLGSLALNGSRETIAYLPQCDLALLLIDASGTLTLEDLGTLRLLQAAGVPTLVLLSKADLLGDADRAASVEYVHGQIEEQMHADILVSSVSAIEPASIDRFYAQELEPRFRDARALRLTSASTKLVRLRDDVVTSLEATLKRARTDAAADAAPGEAHADTSAGGTDTGAAETQRMQQMLVRAGAALAAMERAVVERILQLGFKAPEMTGRVASEAMEGSPEAAGQGFPLSGLAARLQTMVEAEIGAIVEQMQRQTRDVTGEVRAVGRELVRGSLPDEDEIAGLIRDAPRFAMPEMEGTIAPGWSKMFGRRAVAGQVLSALRARLQPIANDELMAYSHALELWAKNTLRGVRLAIDSFAEGYRSSLQGAAQGITAAGTAAIGDAIAQLTLET